MTQSPQTGPGCILLQVLTVPQAHKWFVCIGSMPADPDLTATQQSLMHRQASNIVACHDVQQLRVQDKR